MLKKFLGKEKGITGLETAIILIAFVVVAAVFAYTALSAGLFSTQQAQEAVYSGLQEAQSSLELKGAVYASGNVVGAAGTIQQITFVVSNVLGGESMDFTPPSSFLPLTGTANGSAHKVILNYLDSVHEVSNLYWTVNMLGTDDGDYLLEPGEKAQITVGGPSNLVGAGNLLNAVTVPQLTSNTSFTLTVVTPAGAILTIQRVTPPFINLVMNLR
jgi:flagellin FlaB